MGAVLSFFRPARVAQGDWSQQEFAEFYRVEAALTQAGLRVTGEPGLSDEGDPWFVFCRFDGDVILHFSRIDGLYVVASEAFERPLQGSDFRSLLNTVAERHPTLVPIPRPSAAGAGGKLVLHPAALLAAIVATVAFQLAGGDAIAGEMATPGASTSASGIGGGGASSSAALASDDPPATSVDLGGHQTASRDHVIEDDGRHTRHALILSAMALVTTMLSHEHGTGVRTPDLGDHHAASASESRAVSGVPQAADPFVDGTRPRTNASEASLLARSPVADTAAGGRAMLPGPGGTIQAGAPHAHTTLEGFNIATANVLDLGAAGGQELAVARSAEMALLGSWIPGVRGAPHAVSATASVEKAAVPSSGSGSSSSASASTASAPSGTTTGAPSAAGSGPEPESGGFVVRSLSVTDSQPAAAPAASAASASSASHESGRSMTAAVSATVQAVQSAPVASMTYTITNTEARSALNTFLSQHALSGESGGSGANAASATVGPIIITDPWYRAWANIVGSNASSDVLANLVAHTKNPGTSADVSGGSAIAGTVRPAGATSAALDGAGRDSVSVAHGTGTGGATALTVEPGADGPVKGTVIASTPESGGAGADVGGSPGVTAPTTSGPAALVIVTGAPGPVIGKDAAVAVTVSNEAAGTHAGTTPPSDTASGQTGLATGTGANAIVAAIPSNDAAGTQAGKTPIPDTTTGQTAITTGTEAAGTSTPDKVVVGKPTFVASAAVLDDHARQLIARFLDTTVQVQTIVTNNGLVMIDMDATHYTSPDFALRSWSIGHDVEISIIGLASDTYLAHGPGLVS